MQLDTDKMIAEKDGPIGWMIYNNPARHNAMSLEMQQAIPVILEDFRNDPEVRVVVLRGAGDRAFVSGADISEFESKRSTAEARRHYDEAGSIIRNVLDGHDGDVVALRSSRGAA